MIKITNMELDLLDNGTTRLAVAGKTFVLDEIGSALDAQGLVLLCQDDGLRTPVNLVAELRDLPRRLRAWLAVVAFMDCYHILLKTAHVYETHADGCPYYPGTCMICDGCLALCTVCGCLEGSLPTECPGYDCYAERGDAIYRGEIDFVGGEWVEQSSIHSPASYASDD